MFEIGGIVNARREHGDRRRRRFRGGAMSCKRSKQMARIVADRTHVAAIEDLRERALHHLAVFQNVGDAGRTAQVVFEHVISGRRCRERDPFR